MLSTPNIARRLVAAAILLLAGVVIASLKFSRQSEAGPWLPWGSDFAPSLAVAVVLPLAIFMSDRRIRYPEFLQYSGVAFAGLLIYELAQLVLPRRTFEWNDVLATIAGVATGTLMGNLFFMPFWRQQAPKQDPNRV